MTKEVKSINELTDSRLLFDKNPPKFGYIIIIIVTLVCLGTVIWSIFTPKTYMIKSSGIVTSSDSNYVMSPHTGEIEEINFFEGDIVNKGDVIFKIKSNDYNLQKEQLLENKEIYEKQKSQYELLVKSIKDDKNYFSSAKKDDEFYYSSYELYKSQVIQNEINASEYVAFGYTKEQIESEIKKNQGKISEIYYSAIQEAKSAVNEAKTQIELIESQISAIDSEQKKYIVRANTSGTLHLYEDYKRGMILQETTTIGTITPKNSDSIIEAYISTTDRPRINEGDDVQIVIDGLNYNVYGSVSGKVLHIDSNILTSKNNEGVEVSVFKIKILPDIDYLVSKSGEKINFYNGMSVEARIRYNKITYFNYFMDKFGIRLK